MSPIREVNRNVVDSFAEEPCVPEGVRITLARSCRLSMTRDIMLTEMLLAAVERAPRKAG